MQLPFFKTCTKCGQSKLFNQFSPDKRHTDGKQNWCKDCFRKVAMDKYYAEAEAEGREVVRRHHFSDAELKERHRIQSIEYYYRHPDVVNERNKQWGKQNPKKRKEIDFAAKMRRRARKEQVGGNFTHAEFLEVCARYGNICLCCRQVKPLCADHVIPLSKGGSNSIENIQPLCRSCNCKKHSKTIDYR